MKTTQMADFGLLLLRVGLGLGMAFQHGLGKMQSLLQGSTSFPDPIGIGSQASLFLAATGEFIGGLLVVVGLFPRAGAALVSGTMLVAFFVHHAGDPFGERELAFTYLIGFLAIVLLGGGRWSVERWWRSRKRG